MILVGIDGGLATFGLVVLSNGNGEVALGTWYCTHAAVFTSQSLAKKMNVEMAQDRVRRARDLQRWLAAKLDVHRPKIVAAEAMSFPRGAHAVAAIALSWGVLAAELERRELPLVTAHPKIVRRHLHHSGREADAHAEAKALCPSFLSQISAMASPLVVHALDALAVALWARTTNLVRAAS